LKVQLILMPEMRFVLVCFSYLAQAFGYAGIYYGSATLSTSMLNLVPGFTFVLAVLFRFIPLPSSCLCPYPSFCVCSCFLYLTLTWFISLWGQCECHFWFHKLDVVSKFLLANGFLNVLLSILNQYNVKIIFSYDCWA